MTKLKIVLWTVGVVGKSAVPTLATHPRMELVGCYTYSADKEGADVGTLCGIAPIGVKATRDIHALIALKPDCVLYVPQFGDVDHMVRILESGINIEPVITHRYSYKDFEEGFAAMRTGNSGKVILDWSEI